MKNLKYKFGDIVEYWTMSTNQKGIIWNVYDTERSITDYTILYDTQFKDINENQIIQLNKLGDNLFVSSAGTRRWDIEIFKEHSSSEIIYILNVVSRTNKYDLIIVDYLNKILNYYTTVKLDYIIKSEQLRVAQLLNLIKNKHT